MKAIIVLENYVYDQHIAQPIISRIFRESDINCKLTVCKDPFINCISEATKLENWDRILDAHPMVDLFILIVDRDGKIGREKAFENINEKVVLKGKRFISCLAIEELETWLLAGAKLPNGWRWQDIRGDISVKENWFHSISKEREFFDDPDEGRKKLMSEAMPNFSRMKTLCNELSHLELEISKLKG